MKNNCKRLTKKLVKNSEQKKYFKKGDKLYVKWKGYSDSFNSWIDKKDLKNYIFSETSKSFRSFRKNINVKVDLSTDKKIFQKKITKTDIENISYVDTPSFALKRFR